MRIYLCIHGRPRLQGERLREFIHRPQLEQGCYVWQNRALTVEEHAKVVRKIVEANDDFRIYTKIVPDAAGEDPRDKRIAELEAQLAESREEVGRLRKTINPPRRPRE